MKVRKPRNYWTFEKCKEEALKYKTKIEFKKKSAGAYDKCLKRKWIDSVCKHMLIIGNKIKRCIYSYEFSDNYVYVGLTYNIELRQKIRDYNVNDSVTKHILLTKLIPVRKILTKYVAIDKAIKLEEYYVNKYKKEGWYILNKVKTGATGFIERIWTKEKCYAEALKYNSKVEFSKGSSSAYSIAKREKWLSDICSHMSRPKVHNFKYTYDVCKTEALKFTNSKDFNTLSHSIYVTSCRNKWLSEITKHMK